MKRAVNISLCLASGLVLSTSLRADDAPTDNPYAPIIARNIFGLNPPAPAVVPAPVVEPSVTITPNGIMNVFGRLQALFKAAAPAIAGKPPSENSYMLAEGQGQDGIEVTHINEKKGTITFNNHGVVQEKPLVAATATSTPAQATGGNGQLGQIPPPVNGLPGGSFNNFGGTIPGGNIRPGNRGGGNPTGVNSGLNQSPNLGGVPTRISTYNAASQIPPGVTPETQPIIIEVNRMAAKQQGDPVERLYPITELTEQIESGK
jgi:hypothetical protein